LVDQKGFDLLIRAFARSKLAEEGWRLAIIGEGPRREDLLRLATDLKIGASVDMPGFTQNISERLHRAGIFAFASRFEGFPNALLEAMQIGLPCVSTDCPSGPSDLITDGEDGLLVAVDDEEAMARSLLLLANDGALRKRLSASAREKAKLFAPEIIYPLWEKVILDAIRRRPPDQTGLSNEPGCGKALHG
jgi:glycosyltransferase involved in cell wall biosynthesis